MPRSPCVLLRSPSGRNRRCVYYAFVLSTPLCSPLSPCPFSRSDSARARTVYTVIRYGTEFASDSLSVCKAPCVATLASRREVYGPRVRTSFVYRVRASHVHFVHPFHRVGAVHVLYTARCTGLAIVRRFCAVCANLSVREAPI